MNIFAANQKLCLELFEKWRTEIDPEVKRELRFDITQKLTKIIIFCYYLFN